MVERDGEWEFHLRTLSSSARDSNFAGDPASDPSLLHSVKKLLELCKAEKSDNLIARVYPQLNKIFQRSVASISQSQTSNGLLLLNVTLGYEPAVVTNLVPMHPYLTKYISNHVKF